VCERCARVRLAQAYKDPVARSWRTRWQAVESEARTPELMPWPSTTARRGPITSSAGGCCALYQAERYVLTLEQALAVQEAVRPLPARTTKIIVLRFGIPPADKSHSLAEVADAVRLSKARVQQIESAALQLLREPLQRVAAAQARRRVTRIVVRRRTG
jgi:DNA-directed RNA polymerase specialized sigma24 family protein